MSATVFTKLTSMALLLFLWGCHASPQSKIVGRWNGQGDEKSTTLQFFSDGTLVWYEYGQQKETGRYSFPDATHLLVTEGNQKIVFEINLSGDHLKLMRHQVMFRDVELVRAKSH